MQYFIFDWYNYSFKYYFSLILFLFLGDGVIFDKKLFWKLTPSTENGILTEQLGIPITFNVIFLYKMTLSNS